jgi:hypothetical protein
MYPWNHWKTIVPLSVGFFGLVLFGLWSCTVPAEPILRGSLFKSPTALVSYFGTIVHGMFLWSILYYMPLYFEGAKGFAPVKAGIALFPWTFTTGPAAVVVGLIIARTGKYRWGIWLGWFLTIAGARVLMLFKADTKTSEWIPLSLISGLGMGMLYPAMSFAIQASASNRDLPSAAALFSFFRNFGQMLGVAIGGAIFQNKVKRQMLEFPSLADKATIFSKDASQLVEAIKTWPANQLVEKEELITSYVNALSFLWLVMGFLAIFAFVLAISFTKEFTLERKLETEQGFSSNKLKEANIEMTFKESEIKRPERVAPREGNWI